MCNNQDDLIQQLIYLKKHYWVFIRASWKTEKDNSAIFAGSWHTYLYISWNFGLSP